MTFFGPRPDHHTVYSEDYANAVVEERRASAGESHGKELALAVVIAVAFLGWAAWAFIF